MITTRNLVLAAATLLALGTTALSSTEASAFGFRHGGYSHGYRFGHGGYRHWGYGFHWHRNYAWRSHYRFSYRWRTHFRPAVYNAPAPVMVAAPAIAAAPAPARKSCLAKTYTPQGAVVFTDRCTQESATTPPGGEAPQ